MTCLVLDTGLIISAAVHSEVPTKVDEQTGKYLDSLGTDQHKQTSVNYHFEQHGIQYSKDSMNHRNNPGGKYYEPSKLANPDSNVTNPHRTPVKIQIKEW